MHAGLADPATNERSVSAPASAARFVSGRSLDVAAARARLMRRGVLLAGLGAALALSPSIARADATYEMTLRTTDTLVGGTVELEQRIVVGVKGDRLRQEATGIRAVVTRRGARYEKPGHRLTLEQLDHGRRFEIDLDAATYDEETFADARQQRETQLAAAEKALGIAPREATPSLPVSVDRTGERLSVHGRECERVVLRSTREVVVVGGQDRQLRVFARRRDVFAVFELMHRLLEREQDRLGGVALSWERVFSGPRRDEPQATLVRQRGEITRIESGPLDASAFELPLGLTRDPRSAGGEKP